MKARRYILRLLPVLALLFVSSVLRAQEDSTRVRRDSVSASFSGNLLPALPDAPAPSAGSLSGKLSPDAGQTLPRFLPNPANALPYYTNPSPMFRGDYTTGGTLGRSGRNLFWGSGSQNSIPGIGRMNEATLGYQRELNDKLALQASINAIKMNMDHFSGQSFTAGGALVYRPQEHLRFTLFGSVDMGNAAGLFSMPYQYGGTVGFDLGDHFSMELGVRRYSDSFTGRWETRPVVIPTINFNEKFKLGLDVGPLIYDILRSVIFDQKDRSSGPTIMPDFPHR